MTKRYSRRQALKTLGAVSATAAFPLGLRAQTKEVSVTGRAVEIQITSVSPHTFRLTVLTHETGRVASDGSLLRDDWGKPIARRIYAEARPLYHPLVTRDLDKLGL